MIVLVNIDVLIIHEFLTAGYKRFWATVPASRGFYSMSKLIKRIRAQEKQNII